MLPDLPTAAIVETTIVEMTNDYRKRHTLPEVKPNAELTKAARAYAEFLARSGTFSHTADGRQLTDRASSAGYRYCLVAENLALNQHSQGFKSRDLAKAAVEGWINSPGHRANMVGPYVTEIGVAVAKAPDKDPKYITVQLFGRPRSLQYEFQVSNSSKDVVGYTFGGETHTVDPHHAITHTACQPGAIEFVKAGKKPIAARFEAKDGQVYVLKGTKSGEVKVDVEARETIR